MKKILLAIAILVSSVTAFAQTTGQPSTGNTPSTEQTAPGKVGKSDRKGKKGGKKGEKKLEGNKADRQSRAFEGINLTDDQKAKLSALRTKSENDRKASKQNGEKKKKQDLTPEQKQQRKAERLEARKASRTAYLAGVKEILTPQQYQTFLENNYIQKGLGSKAKKGGKGTKGDNRNGRSQHPSKDKNNGPKRG